MKKHEKLMLIGCLLWVLIILIGAYNVRASVETNLQNVTDIHEDATICYKDTGSFLQFDGPQIQAGKHTAYVIDIRRGYVEFNITDALDVPIGHLYLYYEGDAHITDCQLVSVDVRPSVTAYNLTYWSIGNGTIYADVAGFPVVGTQQVIELNAQAISDLEAAIDAGSNNFTIGVLNEDETGPASTLSQFNSVAGGNPTPTLGIVYDYPYYYNFTGEYYENGTFVGAETVTISSTGTSEDITVNGTVTEYYTTRPTLITWLFGTTTRRYYIVSDTENITITEPDDTYSTYSFEFRDYAGLVGISDSYLEALRTINGTETIVERNIIYNTDTTTPLTLVQNVVYRLRIRLPDGTYYNLGYFTPGSTDPPTFSLTGLGFDDQYQPTSRWITQTSDRVNDTAIQYNYTSTVPGYSTLNVTVSLCYRNGTIIYTNSSVAETVSFTWNNLVNTTTYKVNSTITHEYYGVLDDYSHLISGAFTPETFLSLEGLGISTDLLGAFLLICSAGITSRKFRAVGVAIMATFALVINYWGWLTVPYWLIGLVYAIAGLMFLRGG